MGDLLPPAVSDAMTRHGYDEFEARLYVLGALALNGEDVRQVLRDAIAAEREGCAVQLEAEAQMRIGQAKQDGLVLVERIRARGTK